MICCPACRQPLSEFECTFRVGITVRLQKRMSGDHFYGPIGTAQHERDPELRFTCAKCGYEISDPADVVGTQISFNGTTRPLVHLGRKWSILRGQR